MYKGFTQLYYDQTDQYLSLVFLNFHFLDLVINSVDKFIT